MKGLSEILFFSIGGGGVGGREKEKEGGSILEPTPITWNPLLHLRFDR